MGCGSAPTNVNADRTIIVHGDLFNTDTRNILTILELIQVRYDFKELRYTAFEKQIGTTQFDRENIGKGTPVIEDGSFKNIGPGSQLIELCCLKDQRNEKKLNAKGKPIPHPKGWKPAKDLNPKELKAKI